MSGKDKTTRRSLTLPQSFVAEIAKVREKIGAKSDSEVLCRAFTLYKKLVNPDVSIEMTDKSGNKTKIIVT